MDIRFNDIIQLIKQPRASAIRAVNAELINLYWNIGEYISKKLEKSEWGDSVVTELANYIQQNEPEIKGFSDKNLWRMKQFYETYKDFPKLSPLLREIYIARCTLYYFHSSKDTLHLFVGSNATSLIQIPIL